MMGIKYQFVSILFFCFLAVISFAQSEKAGLKEFRYDIAFLETKFSNCDNLVVSIRELEGVTECSCDESVSRITIYTKERADRNISNEDDFKWVFLDYGLNITQQRRVAISVDGEPVQNISKKDAPAREGGSNSPQQTKSVTIQGKKAYPNK